MRQLRHRSAVVQEVIRRFCRAFAAGQQARTFVVEHCFQLLEGIGRRLEQTFRFRCGETEAIEERTVALRPGAQTAKEDIFA